MLAPTSQCLDWFGAQGLRLDDYVMELVLLSIDSKYIDGY